MIAMQPKGLQYVCCLACILLFEVPVICTQPCPYSGLSTQRAAAVSRVFLPRSWQYGSACSWILSLASFIRHITHAGCNDDVAGWVAHAGAVGAGYCRSAAAGSGRPSAGGGAQDARCPHPSPRCTGKPRHASTSHAPFCLLHCQQKPLLCFLESCIQQPDCALTSAYQLTTSFHTVTCVKILVCPRIIEAHVVWGAEAIGPAAGGAVPPHASRLPLPH